MQEDTFTVCLPFPLMRDYTFQICLQVVFPAIRGLKRQTEEDKLLRVEIIVALPLAGVTWRKQIHTSFYALMASSILRV